LTLSAGPDTPLTFERIQQLGMGQPRELRRALNLRAARTD
jgi:hypothetical protein